MQTAETWAQMLREGLEDKYEFDPSEVIEMSRANLPKEVGFLFSGTFMNAINGLRCMVLTDVDEATIETFIVAFSKRFEVAFQYLKAMGNNSEASH